MPIVPSEYNPPFLFKNGHISTIYHGLFRKVDGLVQQRERLSLSDGDFLDLDWSFAEKQTRKVAILLHGLEGDARRPYIAGVAKLFICAGLDACAVNYRGCSGETNRLFRSYHSGATEDLAAVVEHILETKKYDKIYLTGFSLGGNMALKYLGEERSIPKEIGGAVGISVPCDLYDSLKQLSQPINFPYALRFRKKLVSKLKAKQMLFPQLISDSDIEKIRTLKDFDDIYTSRAHGFMNALDYYRKCSCKQFLPRIDRPVLILNAQNDSFLGQECYPKKETRENPNLYLEIPSFGGHVGYHGPKNITYAEKKALKFLQELN
ncbi:alpha/beta fold hydrolase [Flavobacteriaceae bacterium F89]|uniref:Alpha/beta fold hydrolase n=1 Tax=Cerina litoralis TaxID=2874477 RepID=A0AAE3JR98_9FLAO|nr:alpha/beta fold hydrolase [Cerina litoralis]MCG2459422.1 alpha/beta fold hydrolase [Cerina litoralis]